MSFPQGKPRSGELGCLLQVTIRNRAETGYPTRTPQHCEFYTITASKRVQLLREELSLPCLVIQYVICCLAFWKQMYYKDGALMTSKIINSIFLLIGALFSVYFLNIFLSYSVMSLQKLCRLSETGRNSNLSILR